MAQIFEWPAPGYMANAARTEGEFQDSIEDLLYRAKQLAGGLAPTSQQIAVGGISPDRAAFSVTPEGAATTDELDAIGFANLGDGATATGIVIFVYGTDNKVIHMRNAVFGGATQLLLSRGRDYLLRSASDGIALVQTSGGWRELVRSPGIRAAHVEGVNISHAPFGSGYASFATLVDDTESATPTPIWSAGATDRLTVPAGANYIQLCFGGDLVTASSNRTLEFRKDSTKVANTPDYLLVGGTSSGPWETRPFQATPGDFYRVFVNSGSDSVTVANPYFALEVIE